MCGGAYFSDVSRGGANLMHRKRNKNKLVYVKMPLWCKSRKVLPLLAKPFICCRGFSIGKFLFILIELSTVDHKSEVLEIIERAIAIIYLLLKYVWPRGVLSYWVL